MRRLSGASETGKGRARRGDASVSRVAYLVTSSSASACRGETHTHTHGRASDRARAARHGDTTHATRGRGGATGRRRRRRAAQARRRTGLDASAVALDPHAPWRKALRLLGAHLRAREGDDADAAADADTDAARGGAGRAAAAAYPRYRYTVAGHYRELLVTWLASQLVLARDGAAEADALAATSLSAGDGGAPTTRVGPLFIAGMPRSGTTLLHHLLACDPAAQCLRCSEMDSLSRRAVQPLDTPPPLRAARRWADARALGLAMSVSSAIMPQYEQHHALSPHNPEECLFALQARRRRAPSFLGGLFSSSFFSELRSSFFFLLSSSSSRCRVPKRAGGVIREFRESSRCEECASLRASVARPRCSATCPSIGARRPSCCPSTRYDRSRTRLARSIDRSIARPTDHGGGRRRRAAVHSRGVVGGLPTKAWSRARDAVPHPPARRPSDEGWLFARSTRGGAHPPRDDDARDSERDDDPPSLRRSSFAGNDAARHRSSPASVPPTPPSPDEKHGEIVPAAYRAYARYLRHVARHRQREHEATGGATGGEGEHGEDGEGAADAAAASGDRAPHERRWVLSSSSTHAARCIHDGCDSWCGSDLTPPRVPISPGGCSRGSSSTCATCAICTPRSRTRA